MTNRMLRQILYEQLNKWEFEYGKKFKVDEDYFNKLKLLLRGDISDTVFVKIENGKNYSLWIK